MKSIFKELINAQYGRMNECYSGIKASELTIEILSNKNTIKQYIPTKTVENTEKDRWKTAKDRYHGNRSAGRFY